MNTSYSLLIITHMFGDIWLVSGRVFTVEENFLPRDHHYSVKLITPSKANNRGI